MMNVKCDRKVIRKKKFIYQAPKFARKFGHEDVMYLAVFSENGTSFALQVTSPQ